MLDEYLLAQLDPDTPSIYYHNADQVRLQDALNNITEQEGPELWRNWNKRQRQKFFFLAGRVEDLDTWTRIAQMTWIGAMRAEFNTNIEQEHDEMTDQLDARAQALEDRERDSDLSIAAFLRLQTENETLHLHVTTQAEQITKQQETIDQLTKLLYHRDKGVQAAYDLTDAIIRIQEHRAQTKAIMKEKAIA